MFNVRSIRKADRDNVKTEKKKSFRKKLFVTRSEFFFFSLHTCTKYDAFFVHILAAFSVAVGLCGRVLAVESVEHVFNDEAKIKYKCGAKNEKKI